MFRRPQGFRVLIASAIIVLSALLLLEPAAPALSQGTKKGSTKAYLNDLTNWFNSSDLNSDGYLDKDELAKAFRGPNAKAYDYKDAEKNKDSGTSSPGKVRPMSVALVCLPRHSLASNVTLAELLTYPTEKTAKKKDANYSSLPDYQFLVQLDTDGDKMISRPEFNDWAKTYAKQLKTQADLQKSIVKTQQQLARASARASAQLASTLRQQQQQLDKLSRQMNQAFAKALGGQP
jgi:hypothetical protein